MTEKTKDKIHRAIKLMGEKRVKELYNLFGNQKISFAAIRRELSKEKSQLLCGKKSISEIAAELKISKMTIYRSLYKNKKSHKG